MAIKALAATLVRQVALPVANTAVGNPMAALRLAAVALLAPAAVNTAAGNPMAVLQLAAVALVAPAAVNTAAGNPLAAPRLVAIALLVPAVVNTVARSPRAALQLVAPGAKLVETLVGIKAQLAKVLVGPLALLRPAPALVELATLEHSQVTAATAMAIAIARAIMVGAMVTRTHQAIPVAITTPRMAVELRPAMGMATVTPAMVETVATATTAIAKL